MKMFFAHCSGLFLLLSCSSETDKIDMLSSNYYPNDSTIYRKERVECLDKYSRTITFNLEGEPLSYFKDKNFEISFGGVVYRGSVKRSIPITIDLCKSDLLKNTALIEIRFIDYKINKMFIWSSKQSVNVSSASSLSIKLHRGNKNDDNLDIKIL